ncbi:hypothetical protein APHAL10511_007839 [Amanita phalloides]|nr:hypothetical protein APHAL10511_007839 [Amanita phalloides]
MSLRSDKDRPRKRSPSPSPSPDRPTKQPRTTTAQTSDAPSHRMSPLRRTETYVSLASFCAPAAITPPPPVPLPPVTTTAVPQPSVPSRAPTSPESIPYTRTLHYYKEQRERRKSIIRDGLQAEQDPLFLLIANAFFSHPSPPSQPAQQQQQQIQPNIHYPTCPGSPTRALRSTRSARLRAPHQQFPARPKRKQRNSPPRFKAAFTPVSSPLAPRPYTPSTLYNMRSNSHPDCLRLIPRSRPSPDLHRLSIKIRMQHSQGGQQLLSLGPRLARKVGDAARELERQVDLENALLTPLELPGARPASRPRRPLGRTESVADLSPFMALTARVHTAAPCLTHDVQMADGWVIDLDQEDWDMLDCTA